MMVNQPHREMTGTEVTRAPTGPGASGRYVRQPDGYRAFLPAPLPPNPPVAIQGELLTLLSEADRAPGQLDGSVGVLPHPDLFVAMYVRKEAVLSSQIEGTQSSLSDLLVFELDAAPGSPWKDDVIEVANYVAALTHARERLREGFPVCNRLFREIHEVLLSRGRGSSKMPGEFRRSQNWIGGTRPGNAVFVPPPHTEVSACMSALEKFLHARDDDLPILVRAGLAHVQFETIHPFLDGNGRLGRLLIVLLLSEAGILREPLLYLSLYLKQHRDVYYELLNHVRRTGDWEAWLSFFLEGVRLTADSAVNTSQRLARLFITDRERIEQSGRRAGSTLRVHDALRRRPILSLGQICVDTRLSFAAASAAMNLLTTLGISREITGKRRGRLFAYDEYLVTLSEGTEPL